MSEQALHPRIVAAARGELPEWAVVNASRRAHLQSVAALMEEWGGALGLDERDQERWIAAAWLHDALRNAAPEEFVSAFQFPPPVRHGPAAADRLADEGVADEELLEAIRFHTLGHPGMGKLGRFLFLADYLDPGRAIDPDGRAALRERLPTEEGAVLQAVCGRRIEHQLELGNPLPRETVDFWNELTASHD